MSETDHVWVTTKWTAAERAPYHTDPNCRYVTENHVRKSTAVLFEGRPECQVCANGGRVSGSRDRRPALRDILSKRGEA